jgi:glycopeptide antibiotics resistance protein
VYAFFMTLLADFVLLAHFAITVFLVLGMLLIPLGAYWHWSWVRARRMRQIHAGLMALIAIEAVFNITCPLTVLEALLRHAAAPESFWADQLSKILYWNLPLEFFTILYVCCVIWVLYLWRSVPPRNRT